MLVAKLGISELWICSEIFFRVFHNQKGQDVHEDYVSGFSKKILWDKLDILGPKMTHCHGAGFFIPPLTYFKIQRYSQNGPRFYDVYPRNNAPKIKDGANVINLHEYKSRSSLDNFVWKKW